MSGLIYIGNGFWQPGYPARDLTEDEVKEFGKDKLLATGLYKEVPPKDEPKVIDYAETNEHAVKRIRR
jgi:hypothetical protein